MLSFPLWRIYSAIRNRKKKTISDSLASSTSSMMMVPDTVIKLWINIAKLLFSASEIVSTSLVKRLISSPWV